MCLSTVLQGTSLKEHSGSEAQGAANIQPAVIGSFRGGEPTCYPLHNHHEVTWRVDNKAGRLDKFKIIHKGWECMALSRSWRTRSPLKNGQHIAPVTNSTHHQGCSGDPINIFLGGPSSKSPYLSFIRAKDQVCACSVPPTVTLDPA